MRAGSRLSARVRTGPRAVLVRLELQRIASAARERPLISPGPREPVSRTNHRAAGPAARPTSARLGREPSPGERDRCGAPGNVTAVVRRGVLGDSASSWTELRNATSGRGGHGGRIAKHVAGAGQEREQQSSPGLGASSVGLQERRCLLRLEASIHS